MIPHVDALAAYPRIRFMGSKHRLAPRLAELFATLPPGPAIDAFSRQRRRGLHAQGRRARGAGQRPPDVHGDAGRGAGGQRRTSSSAPTTSSGSARPTATAATSSPRRSTGLYFPDADHAFLDAAWSHVDELEGAKRALALSALCLAAAWKQPRGVFTVTTPRYDDGRRQLRMSLEVLFREAVGALQRRRDARARPARAAAATSSTVDPAEAALVYLDPPYAPPRDDTCYVKRYHFLEGLATYWRGQEIMWETTTRKLASARRRSAPSGRCASRSTACSSTSARRRRWSSPTAPTPTSDAVELEALLRRHRRSVRRIEIPHSYAFGTHAPPRGGSRPSTCSSPS